jgi:hypothetical protein
MTTTGTFMKTLTAGVGPDLPNRKHDVALVQGALKLIKDAAQKAFYAGPIDGQAASGTNAALRRFQLEAMGTLPHSPANLGKVFPGSPTAQALLAKLPSGSRLATIPDHPVVYRAATSEQMGLASGSLDKELRFNAEFRGLLHQLNKTMFIHHSLVLTVAPDSGGFRTFAKQYEMCTTPLPPPFTGMKSDSGPGESNHNFGNGCDFGFFQFAFLKDNGKWQEDDKRNVWLGILPANLALPFWKLRNSYFGKTLFPTKKQGDYVHVQAFDDNIVSMSKSLADLMSRESPNCYWEHKGQYHSNLIFADDGKKWPVGTAKAIWAGEAGVSATELAAVLEKARATRNLIGEYPEPLEEVYLAFAGNNRPPSKPWKAADITPAQIRLMRKYLKEDLEAAGEAYKQWKQVNKS